MQNAIRITNGGTGRIDHQGRRPLVHRTGYDGPGKKKTAVTGERNAFLTSRFIPIAEDYLVEDETGGACVNLTTSENFDYLYRSALRYADLMNVRLPSSRGKGAVPASTSPPCTRPWTRPCRNMSIWRKGPGGSISACTGSMTGRTIPCSGYPSISRRAFLYRYGVSSGNSYGSSYVTTG